MTEEVIVKDRKERITNCRKELEEVLEKYEFAMVAEDYLTPNIKVNVQIQFADLKKYPTAEMAQPVAPVTPVIEK